MPTSSLIVTRQSARYVLPSLNPRPFRSCRFFSLTPYLVTSLLHQSPEPQVTKSLCRPSLFHSIAYKMLFPQPLCFDVHAFFMGGVCVPGVYPLRTSPLFRRANPCAR